MEDFPGVKMQVERIADGTSYTLRISSLNVRAIIDEYQRRHLEFEASNIIDTIDIDLYERLITDTLTRKMMGHIERVVRAKIKKLLKEQRK